MSVDRLFDVKNAFYLGNYQQCINEAQKSAGSAEEKEARQLFLYRSYIAQNKPSIVLSEVPEKAPSAALKAVRKLAEYQNPKRKTKILEEVQAEASSAGSLDDVTAVIYASILLNGHLSEDAIRVLHGHNSLEAHAAMVQSLLQMDRPDLAAKELKKMNEVDEDATITQLATAWVNQALGRDKLKDAFYIYQEMMDKYGATPYLLVGQSSALILQQRYDEAEKLLQEAQSRDPNNAEATINLIVVSGHTGKAPEVVNRLIAQMKDSHEDHPWTRSFIEKENLFDKMATEASA